MLLQEVTVEQHQHCLMTPMSSAADSQQLPAITENDKRM